MKYVKLIGLMAVVASAVMAFAASASAATLTFTAPTGTEYTGTLEATSTNSALDGAFTTVTCKHSQVKGTITSNAGAAISGPISTLDFTECNFPVTVNKAGTLSITTADNSKGETCTEADGDTCRGTATSNGAEVTIETSVGTCVFTTSNTSIGTVTTTSQTGGKGGLDISGKIPRTAGNFLCGSSGTWTGNYTVNNPEKFWIDEK